MEPPTPDAAAAGSEAGTGAVHGGVSDRTGGDGASPAAPDPQHIEAKNPAELPTVVLVVGMAGSGKTRFMHRMNIEMHEKQVPSFFVNLDPAVLDVPYGVNIDIRDTVSHKEVMKQYGLGPNGAIITSLNLFATRFDQVLGYIESRQKELKYVFIDTPGQIEVFTWSASGQIIMETLASTFPTVICYVMDTARSQNPTTFMSNMLYSCGMLYRTQLPLVLCMNKIDIADHHEPLRWMQDVEAFEEALQNDSAYSAQLTKSMAVVMQEFYENFRSAAMSAVTGEGADKMLAAIAEAREDYVDVYLPELKEKLKKRRADEARKQEEDINRLATDLEKTKGFKVVASKGQVWEGPSFDDTERTMHQMRQMTTDADDEDDDDDDDEARSDDKVTDPYAVPDNLPKFRQQQEPRPDELTPDEEESHKIFMEMLAERSAKMEELRKKGLLPEEYK